MTVGRLRTLVSEGLALLGGELDIDLDLSEDGVCGLFLEDGLECVIEVGPDDGPLFLYAQLVPVPAQDREALFEEALSLNLFGLETGAASIAYDRDTAALMLCYQCPIAEFAPEQVAGLIVAFIERADQLRSRLQQAGSPRDSDEAAEGRQDLGVIDKIV